MGTRTANSLVRHTWVMPPPKGLLSSCFRRDPRFGRAPGVYPVYVTGTYALTDEDDAKPNDEKEIINLCWIPHGVQLTSFVIATGGVSGRLEDSMPEPTVYLDDLSGNVVTMANMDGDDARHLGTMYMDTPRRIGPDGPEVLQWHQGLVLRIHNASGHPHHPTEKPLTFMLSWAPVWDGGY